MKTSIRILMGMFVIALLVGCCLLSGARDAVDWRRARVVAIESDDWGLAGFFPDSSALIGLDLDALEAGDFPPVYWSSTLEDSADVADLAAVLHGCRGRDDLPAVFQANYIVSSLDWQVADDGDGRWTVYDLPDLPPRWSREGLWEAVDEAVAGGVWWPELHGRYHYDPARRMEFALSTPVARAATRRGILLFPYSASAFELGSWRAPDEIAADLDRMIVIFSDLFGRSPESVIAPDYLWQAGTEDLWESRHLLVIQAKREQRYPSSRGLVGRAAKYLERSVAVRLHPRRRYLERNCRLETAQAQDWRQVVDTCRNEIHAAWNAGKPAVVETHRINFVCLDRTKAVEGRLALKQLLDGLVAVDVGESAPLYLCDAEIASLARNGVSCRRAGDRIILRNLTHGWRHVFLPASAATPHLLRACALPPHSTRFFPCVASMSIDHLLK